ncbi:MAG: leucyl aminopeptidase [Gemmatimonadetes bacterium]|nr:leucyl aminopeptidase [Gemmatimonadota bacterium]
MNVGCVSSAGAVSHDTPLLVLPVHEPEEESEAPKAEVLAPEGLSNVLSGAFPVEDLKHKPGESALVYLNEGGGPRRVLLLGAGKASGFDLEATRRFAGHAVRAAESVGVSGLTTYLGSDVSADAVQAATEGAVLAAWRFTEMKSPDQGDAPTDVEDFEVMVDPEDLDTAEAGVQVGGVVGRAANFARTLQSRPGNVATPSHLADEASRMAGEHGLEVTVMGPKELEAERMHALLAVAQGSEEEPRLIVLRHNGGSDDEAPLVLVGKGLTFDAGGISIKPASGMEEMIFDMSGGAAVIGAMQAIGELNVPLNVVGIVPSSENLLSGRAMKPGDIIRSREGKTIEVVNTDAEGRLILADALSYAQGFDPAAIVDCATLTGSVVIALGHHAAAVFGTDEELIGELREAGDRSGERCWPLPLWDDYRRQIDSSVADLANVGGRPGGSITAACFLREFVGECRWAHLDIAGTAYGEGKLSYQRKGASGFPTRLLVDWVRSRAR